jgi:pimeloyl-[acyl-carrier protein] methyl ester esterase
MTRSRSQRRSDERLFRVNSTARNTLYWNCSRKLKQGETLTPLSPVLARSVQLVLLPGMDGTGTLFEPIKQALEPHFSLQIITYPEHEILGYKELEEHIQPFITSRRFVLLGESFSGPLAISIAAKRPPGLCGVILCCSFARNPRPNLVFLRGLLSLWFSRQIPPYALTQLATPMLLGGLANQYIKALLKNALRKVSPAVINHRAQEVLAVDVIEKLKLLDVPLMYLRAAQDRVVPLEAAKLIAQAHGSMKLVTIDGPHCLLQVSPNPSAQAIKAFCDQLG